MTEPRLSDAELDALGKDARWDSLYGERAIAELRALREQGADLERGHNEAVARLLIVEEQNAKLVAALEKWGFHPRGRAAQVAAYKEAPRRAR